MISTDTIAAISSAVGACARMIVRLSGTRALEISGSIATETSLIEPAATRARLRFAGLELAAFLYLFKAPHSYTGEDLVEFHLPGNPLLARMLMEELVRLGARPADAGEFTARAYFDGRMDLAEAEGVAATVAAANEQELRAARQLMSGELSRRLTPIMDALAQTLALVEVGIDFSDEDMTFLSAPEVATRLAQVDASLDLLVRESSRFERVSHEPVFVLVGRPNAGKSTLLNALAGHERAVVSSVAGTTRDVLSAEVKLARGIVKVLDVAGIEETSTDEHIARKMRQHALREVKTADHVVLVRDLTDSQGPLDLPRKPDLQVWTKADLETLHHPDGQRVSAITGQGMEALRTRLDELAFRSAAGNAVLALNARHVAAIDEARTALRRAHGAVGAGAEVQAMELREALDALGQILGQVSPDDLLGRIFSKFCIGK